MAKIKFCLKNLFEFYHWLSLKLKKLKMQLQYKEKAHIQSVINKKKSITFTSSTGWVSKLSFRIFWNVCYPLKAFMHKSRKKCAKNVPVFIFKTARSNFDRRKMQRDQIYKLGLQNYYFIVGDTTEDENRSVKFKLQGTFS